MAKNRVYQNVGLIRTNNLSDVDDPRKALTNLLNDLVSGESTFTAADVEPIKGLSNTRVVASDFRKISDITVRQSAINDSNDIIEVISTPFITLKNRVDQIVQTTNDPPFFNGGDGLSAKFWDSDNISSSISKASSGDDFFVSPADSEKDVYWSSGYFNFTNALDDSLAGANGGIQWSGFYIPSKTGTTEFVFNSSGFFVLELENQSGNLEVVKSIFDNQITLSAAQAVNGDTIVPISANDYKFAAVGARFNPATLEEVEVLDVKWDLETDTYTLELSSAVTLSANESFVLDYEQKIGIDTFTVRYPFRNLEAYSSRSIRITLWFPGNEQYFLKVMSSEFRLNNDPLGDLYFWNLYTAVSSDSEITNDQFKSFFEKRLLSNGGTIGSAAVSSSDEYNSVKTNSPLQVKYTPPMTMGNILNDTYSYKREIDSNVFTMTSGSNITANLEIGNYVTGEGIPVGSTITDISTNNVVVIDNDVTVGSTSPIDFIDHRGIVTVLEATSSGSTVTVNDTSELREGLVVIPNSTLTNYCRITSIVSTTQFETSIDLNLTGTEVIYVYLDKGLLNQSLDNFCIGVYGKEIAGGTGDVVTIGDTVLPLNNVDNISVGMVVQSTGFIPDGTTVTSINTTASTVTISQGATSNMIAGITVVFVPADPSGVTLNKEQCIIPLNTAPPFTGTDTGLATTDNVTLSTNGSTINAVSLTAQTVSTSELATPVVNYDKKVQLGVAGSVFYILSSSS